MGRKSRKRLQLKPFCYFCNREFDDEKVLIQHQKAKHFKCGECNRKLETANGLAVHMQQVHKLIQRKVPSALEGRDDVNSVVQGMYGVPVDAVEEHQMKHYKKMGDIDSKKQQRISWAIVTAAPTPEQFIAQLSIGNIYFPGFTAMPENYIQPQRFPPLQPAYGQMHGQAAQYQPHPINMPQQGNPMNYGPASAGRPPHQTHAMGFQKSGFSGPDTRTNNNVNSRGAASFQTVDEVAGNRGFGPSASGPLILGPKGTPIDASKFSVASNVASSQRSMSVNPTSASVGNFSSTTAPRGFSDGPITIPKSGGFSGPSGFSKPTGFSNTPSGATNKGFSRPGGFSDAPATNRPMQKIVHREEREQQATLKKDDADLAEKSKVTQTQYYKTTGVAPLFIPPPSLGKTKLVYDNDALSIEEVRAKSLFQWEEGS